MPARHSNPAPSHWLCPPERWFADWILDRQQTHRTPAILRMERNYGPEAIALWAVATIAGLLGGVVGCAGLTCLLLSGDHGALLAAGYSLLLAGIVLEIPSLIRSVQGIYTGRRFRGDRPFEKRP